ncbi:hypothetical protein SKAU_G00365380 [Synaphobranchus kaupii]|uniref:Uncharacterized protein n=1 Tax=Synaphobranchus kaupii TaxID=118154 RepID=A0A9Q1EEZ0_SYNKA|nr:hypothetical protein SKAU_G00365380 [Synaphobranchus kaupii]
MASRTQGTVLQFVFAGEAGEGQLPERPPVLALALSQEGRCLPPDLCPLRCPFGTPCLQACWGRRRLRSACSATGKFDQPQLPTPTHEAVVSSTYQMKARCREEGFVDRSAAVVLADA